MKPAIISAVVGGVLVDVSPYTPPSTPIGVRGAPIPCVLARISRQGLAGDCTSTSRRSTHALPSANDSSVCGPCTPSKKASSLVRQVGVMNSTDWAGETKGRVTGIATSRGRSGDVDGRTIGSTHVSSPISDVVPSTSSCAV